MKIGTCIDSLISYAMNTGLADPADHQVLRNRLLELLGLDADVPSDELQSEDLEQILKGILDYATQQGLCEDGITARDLFDTRVMGALTPMPREVIRTFREKYAQAPEAATDWFYKFSQDTDYIRRYRICKDMRWKTPTDYGDLDITINLSKPEKDPKAIAAAKAAPQSGYPKCLLCRENEGYAGRVDHPARQNHRIVPVTIGGKDWFLQYSPYVYYHEHCIVFNAEHTPMVIDKGALGKLLDFVTVFPHYFVGSNADLSIVGGSILSHEHFQGGHYSFPMERAPVEREVAFAGFGDIKAGIVKWPMSVLRITGPHKERVVELADKILSRWRGYTDAEAFIFAQTEGTPHNTITPIARRRGADYELDLVLRNNITTQEHPLGVFHPHGELHHIKKENIGLIEVMGLAVLPARLKGELSAIEEAILGGTPLTGDLVKHGLWVEELMRRHSFTPENIGDILKVEVGMVFAQVLEHAGVFKRDPEGMAAFDRFVRFVDQG